MRVGLLPSARYRLQPVVEIIEDAAIVAPRSCWKPDSTSVVCPLVRSWNHAEPPAIQKRSPSDSTAMSPSSVVGPNPGWVIVSSALVGRAGAEEIRRSAPPLAESASRIPPVRGSAAICTGWWRTMW